MNEKEKKLHNKKNPKECRKLSIWFLDTIKGTITDKERQKRKERRNKERMQTKVSSLELLMCSASPVLSFFNRLLWAQMVSSKVINYLELPAQDVTNRTPPFYLRTAEVIPVHCLRP